jgi:hypothetical protein
MSRFEDWAKYNQIEKISEFIKSLGYKRKSESSSQNQIFEDNNSIIIISEKNYEHIGKIGGYKNNEKEASKKGRN